MEAEKASILIVDDESLVAHDLAATVKGLGYSVAAVACSGPEALETAGRAQPDLVLMDINLGGALDGIEAATEIKNRLQIPVIYITGTDDDGTFERARQSGPMGFIVKPFEEKELRPVIELALHRHREETTRLIMNEKLASVGQMLAVVTHEINNPLASIAGCAEGMLKRVKEGRVETELFERYLGIIEEEVNRCRGITNGILSQVRRGPEEAGELDVRSVLEKTLEIAGLQGRLGRVELRMDFPEELPPVRAVEGQLRQVFTAIIMNALDAMEEEGRLSLGARQEEDEVIVEIGDSGPGIPESIREEIFKPFFSTKTGNGGTGLGLFVVRKIILNNGGAVSVESEEGRGTTFSIGFPASASSGPSA